MRNLIYNTEIIHLFSKISSTSTCWKVCFNKSQQQRFIESSHFRRNSGRKRNKDKIGDEKEAEYTETTLLTNTQFVP